MRKYLEAEIINVTKEKNKEKWLEFRKSGIGGSDAASVLGLNPYRSSMSVYLEKNSTLDLTTSGINNKFNYQVENNSDVNKDESNYKMELGCKLEDFVAKEFTLKTGKKVRNINGILKNNKYPFALANIDRAVIGEKAFLECKVTNSYSKKVWELGVPIHYQIQVNHYMAVTGATHCYVAALIGNEKLVIHKVERDEEIIDEIMRLEKMFWEKCVLGDEIPSPDGSTDYSQVLQQFYKNSKDETVILFEQETVLERYDEITQLYKEIDQERKKIEQYLQTQMKEYEIAYVGDRKITWKKHERNTIDTKKLKKELPEVASKYMKTTTSRVFRMN